MSAAEEIIENEAASKELLDRMARGDERFVTIYLDSDEEGGLRAVQHVPEGFRAISLIGTVLPRRPAPKPREAEGDAGEDEREVGAAELLAGAVAYVLERASEEPDGLGRYLSPTTSAWRLLVAAEAAHLGKCPVRHRILREGGDPARVLEAWELLPPEVGDAYDGEALARDPNPVIRVDGLEDEVTITPELWARGPAEVFSHLGRDDELFHQAALRFDMGAETVTFRPSRPGEA